MSNIVFGIPNSIQKKYGPKFWEFPTLLYPLHLCVYVGVGVGGEFQRQKWTKNFEIPNFSIWGVPLVCGIAHCTI